MSKIHAGLWSVLASCLVLPLAAQQTPADPPPPKPKGLQWQVGDYSLKLGGFIKVDLIHDFDEIGSTDSFDPRTIPTSGSSEPGDSTRIHARSSRINLDVSGPTSAGPLRTFVEGDFFGDGNSFRLRHIFGTLGPVLGGQTWTTFMDEDALPETIDFEMPIAYPMVRQAQIRLTHKLEDGSYGAISLEDPDSEVLPPTGVTGEVDEPLPDVNARLHWKNERGHVQLGLFGGMARFDPDAGSPADAMLWGLNLSTKLRTFGSDNAVLQVTYGDGVGRYRGGTAAAADGSGHLDAVPIFGALVSYQHHWSEQFRSTVAYSWGEGDVPAGAPLTTTEEVTYLAANLIWQFADRAWAGIEYLHGSHHTFDDADGQADRLQLALRFDI